MMNKNMSEESHKKIFISHSSKDKQIVDIFVDKLLHLGLQIDPNDVAYTSREETGVGTGEDIRKFIHYCPVKAGKSVFEIVET